MIFRTEIFPRASVLVSSGVIPRLLDGLIIIDYRLISTLYKRVGKIAYWVIKLSHEHPRRLCLHGYDSGVRSESAGVSFLRQISGSLRMTWWLMIMMQIR
jgi:hypothetical protein